MGKVHLHFPFSSIELMAVGTKPYQKKVGGMVEMEDRWLSVDEMSKYLGVSSDTVYRWIDKHNMPAHRMGRLWKFKKDEVDAWVKSGGADKVRDEKGKRG